MANSVQKALGYRDIIYNINEEKFFTFSEGDNYQELDIATGGGGGGGGGTLQEVTDNGNFADNDIDIGGTSADPNIELKASDGSITAAGQIESESGGFKFPDGTIQTSAATGGGGEDGEPVRVACQDSAPSLIGGVPVEAGDLWLNTSNLQLYTYYFDPSEDQYWVSVSKAGEKGAPQKMAVSDSPPTTIDGQPVASGDTWFNSATATQYVRYKDPNGDEYWVSTTTVAPAIAQVGASPPANPTTGQLFWSTADSKLQIYVDSSWVDV